MDKWKLDSKTANMLLESSFKSSSAYMFDCRLFCGNKNLVYLLLILNKNFVLCFANWFGAFSSNRLLREKFLRGRFQR